MITVEQAQNIIANHEMALDFFEEQESVSLNEHVFVKQLRILLGATRYSLQHGMPIHHLLQALEEYDDITNPKGLER